MGYMKASSHHRIFAIRSGSDGVEDYLENNLLGAFAMKSMKIEPVVKQKSSSVFFLLFFIYFDLYSSFFAYFE